MMTNQLTELFDMTDTSDVPDAAIEAVLKLLNCRWTIDSVRSDAQAEVETDRTILALARLIAREHPEWIEDPDLAAVRELWAAEKEGEGAPSLARDTRARMYDDAPGMKARLAAFKAGRAAERAGQ